MIISVKNDNISLEPITQVCGTNIKRKNAIINNIVKYFSSSKYAEYDEMQAYDIRVDDKVVGRKYFNVYRIKSKEDLVCGIEISKTSLMKKYLDYINTQYDNQIVYENIVNEYMKIFKHINDEMEKSDINLYMDFLEEKINDIAFRNILNSRSMLLEQPDYKKQRKIHSEEGKDDEQTD